MLKMRGENKFVVLVVTQLESITSYIVLFQTKSCQQATAIVIAFSH